MTLQWNGKKALQDVLRASKLGMDDTTDAIVDSAKARVRVATGNLRDSIDKEEAVIERGEVVAAVGVSDKHRVTYGLIQEIRNPYLRPAVDAEQGALLGNIRKHFK